jgi:hypothetical protein
MMEVTESGAPMGLDILNSKDLSTTSTEYPLLSAGLARVVVHKLEVAPNKAGTGHNLKLQIKTTSELPLHGGGKQAAGHVLLETISVTKSEKYDPNVKETPSGGWGSLLGQTGDVRLKVEESAEFGDRNRVASWIEKTEASVASAL